MTKKDYMQIVVLTCLMVVIVKFFVTPTIVISGSMEPTIDTYSINTTNASVYFNNSPKRQDVVMFKCPYMNKKFCKRIIGLPGETVHSAKGKVFIQSKEMQNCLFKLKESYIVDTLEDSWDVYVPKKGDIVIEKDNVGYINNYPIGDYNTFVNKYCELDGQEMVVKDDCYFMMGDNRTNSDDSRFWPSGLNYVTKGDIIGRIDYCVLSKNLKSIGRIK